MSITETKPVEAETSEGRPVSHIVNAAEYPVSYCGVDVSDDDHICDAKYACGCAPCVPCKAADHLRRFSR